MATDATALLHAVFEASGLSQPEFAAQLAHAIAPDRKPFSGQYVSGLLHGRFAITPEIALALEYIAAQQDGVDEVQARARPVTVPLLALHPPTAHAIIMGRDRPCANPGCRVRFYPASPRQQYHSAACRAAAAQHRKRSRNG